MTAPNYLPPMQTNPPDYLTEVAAEWHEAFQMVAAQYGQSETGVTWKATPLSYKHCLRHVVLTLLERSVFLQNWHRGHEKE